jgi:hypothetical protein
MIVRNADETENILGRVKEKAYLAMKVGNHREVIRFFVSDIGRDNIILGHAWLRKHNPDINWRSQKLLFHHCLPYCQLSLDDQWRRSAAPKADFIAHKRRHPRRYTARANGVPPPDIPTIYDEGEEGLIRRFIMSPQDDTIDKGDALYIGIPDEVYVKRTTQSTALAAVENAQKESKTLEEMIPPQYLSFRSVFEEETSRALPPFRKWDHAIDLQPDAIPSNNCKVYPLNPEEQKALDAFLADMLDRGYIRSSQSPFASPFFFVKKKDGKLRPVQDYRQLNALTVKNQYPLPLISDIVDKLSSARYFTKFDVRWGYNNIRIKEGDEWKAAFKTNRGMFEPLVMFFGLTNSPATFQTMMNEIFKDLADTGKVFIYMDDILIATPTLEEHRQLVSQVLQRLKDHYLFLKPEKCEFEQDEVEYLGLRVRAGALAMDPVKVKGVADWPTPVKLRDVRAFLGFAGFYRRFIRNFSRLARPMNDLTKKDTPWTWGSLQQQSFDNMKARFTDAPVLLQPDLSTPFRLECDASKFACGAVLSQQGEDGLWHPVAFMSKSFIEAERNYDIYDRELLAIIRALEEWRHYLEGSPHPVEILSDHKNLEVFREARKLSRRQARWALFLTRFNFHITHVSGKTAGKPDALSRRADHDTGDADNEDVTLLPTSLFVKTITFSLPPISDDLMRRFRNCQQIDETVIEVLRSIAANKSTPLTATLKKHWSVQDGLVFYSGRLYVPNDLALRRDMVRIHHDLPSAGHPGRLKTLDLIQRSIWWPGMRKFIFAYVDGCATCQATKNLPNRPPIPLLPITPEENPTPFSTVSMDFITELPISNGFDAIAVFVDHDLTKAAIIVPCSTSITAEGTAKIYQEHVWKRFGLPRKIISDRGTQFTASFTVELCRLLQISQAMSTAYHPQTDGQTERLNQELEQFLRAYTSLRQADWADHLSAAEFAHNSHSHSTTNTAPFFALMGYHPASLPLSFLSTANPLVSDRLDMLSSLRADIVTAQAIAHRQWTTSTPPPSYSIGDLVWLDGKNLRTSHPSSKLAPRRYGPFPIEKIVNPVTFRLTIPTSWSSRIHPVFHASLLTPYRETAAHGPNFTRPPPDLIGPDNAEEWEVAQVLDSRFYRGKLQYFVSWVGYPSSDNMWLPASALANSADLVASFHRSHPSAASPTHHPAPSRRRRAI